MDNSSGSAGGWRANCVLREEVKKGGMKSADFAADLEKAYRGDGLRIYADPSEFFARTYAGYQLKELVADVLKRLAGGDGEPVTWLHVAYGGGKTHSLIALMHMARSGRLPGIAADATVKSFLNTAGLSAAPLATVALLPCDKFDIKMGLQVVGPDGTRKTVMTPWGALAYQLGGDEGFRRVEEHERDWATPAQPLIESLLRMPAEKDPERGSLILVDELVELAANAMGADYNRLGVLQSFFQYLTQAVAATPRCALVATLLSANMTGTPYKQQALEILEQIFVRISKNRTPIGTDDVAELLRRRLFESIPSPAETDNIVSAMMGAYKNAPGMTDLQRGAEMEKRLRAAYPFHPDLIDIFYTKWTALPSGSFQRTRSSLRLLAEALREASDFDDAPVVNPGVFLSAPGSKDFSVALTELDTIAGGDSRVWRPKLEKEFEFAREIQQAIPKLGPGREIERAVLSTFLHSQPQSMESMKATNPELWGLLVTPGMDSASLESGLEEWRKRSWFLSEEPQTWRLTTLPSLNQMFAESVKEIKKQQCEEAVFAAIKGNKELFDIDKNGADVGVEVHKALPDNSMDIPDMVALQYVPLSPSLPATPGEAVPSAIAKLFQNKGAGGRQFKNALLLLTATPASVASLKVQVETMLGWTRVQELKRKQLTELQQRELDRKVFDARNALPSAVKAAYNVLVCLNAEGVAVAQNIPGADELGAKDALGGADSRPFARIKALLGNEDRLLLRPMAARHLQPRGAYDVWALGETAKRADDVRALFSSTPRLPRLLSASQLRETLKQGCRDGIFALRYARPSDRVEMWWRIPPSEDDLMRSDLEILPAASAILSRLSPELLSPPLPGGESPLPGLWPEAEGGGLLVRDITAYFDGVKKPCLAPDALNEAIHRAVSKGIVRARTAQKSYQNESLPESEIQPDMELLPPLPPLSVEELLPSALPALWTEDEASLALLAEELRSQISGPYPVALLRAAVAEGIQNRQWVVNGDGLLPTDSAALLRLTLRRTPLGVVTGGGSSGPGNVRPPSPEPPIPKVRELGVVYAEHSSTSVLNLNKIASVAGTLQGMIPEVTMTFTVGIAIEGKTLSDEDVAGLNKILIDSGLSMRFEK